MQIALEIAISYELKKRGNRLRFFSLFVCLMVSAGHLLNDLHQFNPATMFWTELTMAIIGTKPSPRAGHGFVSTTKGDLYVFGGDEASGKFVL
jgi:hypothetical protein